LQAILQTRAECVDGGLSTDRIVTPRFLHPICWRPDAVNLRGDRGTESARITTAGAAVAVCVVIESRVAGVTGQKSVGRRPGPDRISRLLRHRECSQCSALSLASARDRGVSIALLDRSYRRRRFCDVGRR
jgi:hypothetical protein